MKRMTEITVLCLALMGCSSVPSENRTQYLRTEMQSTVSGPTTVTMTADSLLKKENTRHLILYALRPLPGKVLTSELDRKFAAATMYIDLSPNKGNRTAEISGEINYYDYERYVNARLIGDSVMTIPVAPQTIPLTLNKPFPINLPQGIHYSVMLTDSQP
ncbi:hypothetical protein PEC106568_04890 [Pectobacterium carotovorum subsp. carotovorum]|uniref:hypothetical protein n=2 Tax=Pectobacterium brasiliense TaxID=180957 RepID=UPI000A4FACC5|nr:hypothetical protein [Pectobacterium brasiliense]MBN3133218.1 hypothetical protein [Pectobacterium brasiliense]GKV75315.1 hypothetical protein PEC106568_04890 [Pectobacterium carotovorum subsp. carotovorum]